MQYSQNFFLVLLLFFGISNSLFSQDINSEAEQSLQVAYEKYLEGTNTNWLQIIQTFEQYLIDSDFKKDGQTIEMAYLNFLQFRAKSNLLPKMKNKSEIRKLLDNAKISKEYYQKNNQLRAFEKIGYPIAQKYIPKLKDKEKIKDLLLMIVPLYEIALEMPGESLSPTLLSGSFQIFITENEIKKIVFKQAIILLLSFDLVYWDDRIYGK